MATYNQYYKAGKKKAAKKMTREEKLKLAEARRLEAKHYGLPSNNGKCKKCAYFYQNRCTYDDTEIPEVIQCSNFVRKR